MKLFRKMFLAAPLARFRRRRCSPARRVTAGRVDPLAHGMNWGIFTLLGVVVLMLSSIATFFVLRHPPGSGDAGKENGRRKFIWS